MATDLQTLESLCVNVIRGLAMDGPQEANSGHPGTAMACAPIGWTLYGRSMRHNPANPDWFNRDRFILSCGHACILQYSLLHLSGYALSRDDLLNFRQWGSKTPGHPENFHTVGIETTTGPLGQGFANGVGMALAERFLASHFNTPEHQLVDHYTYVLASDGDLMEGVCCEASSIAGHLKLGKLIVFWDDNHITIEGDTDLAFTEDVDAKYAAMGWHVQRVDDPNDMAALEAAVEAAKKDERPSLISVRTIIAYPSPKLQNTAKSHGSPLGAEEIAKTKEVLGLPPQEKFYVPSELQSLRDQVLERGRQAEEEWNALWDAYQKANPELALEFKRFNAGELPEGWEEALPVFPADAKGMASRAASGKVLNALAPKLKNLIGGSADLAGSTKTLMDCTSSQSAENPGGRNMHFGVREHAMASMVNGMSLHGGLIPYCATFFVFTDYMRPALRLAALMSLPTISVLTHDSIGLGEDGPTHQPTEHLPSLRAMVGLTLIRPADANETREAWKAALTLKSEPVCLVLSRQNLPTLDRQSLGAADGLHRGAYVLSEADGEAELILISSGAEIHPVLEAQKLLQAAGKPTRVVSMPSWELFERQDRSYQEQVLPPTVRKRLAVEAAGTFGWHRWITEDGAAIGIDGFGASAPAPVNMEKFGFTAQNIRDRALEL